MLSNKIINTLNKGVRESEAIIAVQKKVKSMNKVQLEELKATGTNIEKVMQYLN